MEGGGSSMELWSSTPNEFYLKFICKDRCNNAESFT
jgi:hypothetical protein